MIATRGALEALVVASLLWSGAPAALGQPAADPAYAEVFYPSGRLRIQAYLYRPDGAGPFPTVIYNHGSRPPARERQSVPFEHIGRLLTRAGYAVLVTERRGYGRSDGPTWSQEVGANPGRVVPRLEAETDDVLAAAGRVTTPMLLLVSENDRTTASITAVGDALERRGIAHRVVIYPPFGPGRTLGAGAPGHQVFSARACPCGSRTCSSSLAATCVTVAGPRGKPAPHPALSPEGRGG